ncbi:hypothetical protein [Microbispora sp. NPDC049633]|uniref:hypothetical protein n=1 Tax=Microbispora sp. NPDC049633 TaxID=3154355 RepID=UPI003436B36B
MDLQITTLAERPELEPQMWSMPDSWPVFMVPGALVPVHCDADHGFAVYVEPNVWVRHSLR